MVRVLFPIATLVLVCGVLIADGNKNEKPKSDNAIHATFVNADIAKQTVTFKAPDKTGKNSEVTLALAKDAKILTANAKSESFAEFVKNMQSAKEKAFLVVEDSGGKMIIELRDQSKKQ